MLVVDLDRTLLRTDMLYETFCAAVARDWRNMFLALPALIRGPAELKGFLAEAAMVDVATLPYDESVLNLIGDHRNGGGKTALVSAAHHDLVARIADHLGVFDEAFGSDGETNLKGHAKGAKGEPDQFTKRGTGGGGDGVLFEKARSSAAGAAASPPVRAALAAHAPTEPASRRTTT